MVAKLKLKGIDLKELLLANSARISSKRSSFSLLSFCQAFVVGLLSSSTDTL